MVDYLYNGVNQKIEKHLDSDADIIHPYDGWRFVHRSLGESGFIAERENASAARRSGFAMLVLVVACLD